MSIVPAPTGAVVPVRRSSVGSSKRQKATQEDHFVVQVPDDVAERLRAAIRGESAAPEMGVVFGPEPSSGDARTATFRFDGEEQPSLSVEGFDLATHGAFDGSGEAWVGFTSSTGIAPIDADLLSFSFCRHPGCDAA